MKQLSPLNLGFSSEDIRKVSGSIICLANSGVKVNLTGTTSETLLYTLALPDGIMGPNSSLQIEPAFNWTNSANNKTVKIAVGQTLVGATTLFTRTRTTTGDLPLIRLTNRGVTNSQIEVFSGMGVYGANSANFLVENTRAANFSLPNLNLYITGTLANAGESLDLNAVMVSVINAYQ
jgi:hypothetical protein